MNPETLLKNLTKAAAETAYDRGYKAGYEAAQKELLSLSGTIPASSRRIRTVRPPAEVAEIRRKILDLLKEAGTVGLKADELRAALPSRKDYNLVYGLVREDKVSHHKRRFYLKRYYHISQDLSKDLSNAQV